MDNNTAKVNKRSPSPITVPSAAPFVLAARRCYEIGHLWNQLRKQCGDTGGSPPSDGSPDRISHRDFGIAQKIVYCSSSSDILWLIVNV